MIEPGASFIHPDGTVTRVSEHPDTKASFIDDTGSVRIRSSIDKTGSTLHVSVPKAGITPEQVDLIKQAVGQNRFGNFVLERSDVGPENHQKVTRAVQYSRPVDFEVALKEIGAHPDQAAHPDWIPNTLKAMDEQPAGAFNPHTGTTEAAGPGIEGGIEVYPEARAAREALDHKPTEQDLTDFYNEHKAIFDKHPELRVGWDKTGAGWELNVGAAGTREGAIAVGNKLDQRAAWDIEKQEEIPLKGKGEKTSFEDYPLEQRLRELKSEKPATIGPPEVRGEEKAPKGATTELLKNPIPRTEEELQLFGDKVHKGLSVAGTALSDFQKTMGEWVRETAGKISKPSAVINRAINIAHNEINHWIMENGGEGKGWYSKMTNNAMKVLKELHPALEDPAHQGIFKALWAAHSYGNEPFANIEQAERNLTNLEKTGSVAYNQGETDPDTGRIKNWSGHSGNVSTLAKTQHLIDTLGEKGAVDFLTTKHTWPEIEQQFKSGDLNVYKRGIAFDADGKTYGAHAFGPKGGAFYLNLMGITDHTTVDVWGTRALRRWEGRVGDPNTLSPDPNTGLLSDVSPTVPEIERYRKVVGEVAKKLGLDTPDVQALQWYYEHKLYEVHGVGEAARDYEEAARNVVENRKSGVRPGENEKTGRAVASRREDAQTRGLFEGDERNRGREPGDEGPEIIKQAEVRADEIPGALLPKGYTTEMIHSHEWGHVLAAADHGLDSVDIKSHLHPESQPGAAATTFFDFSKYAMDERGRIPVEKYASIFGDELMPTYMGGAVINHLVDGIPIHENKGLVGDLQTVRQGLGFLGLGPVATDDVIWATARKEINRLTGDPALDIIKKYSAEREVGAPDTHIATNERIQQFYKDIEEARRGTKYKRPVPSTGDSGGSVGSNEAIIPKSETKGAGAGQEGNLREGHGKKVRQGLVGAAALGTGIAGGLSALTGEKKESEEELDPSAGFVLKPTNVAPKTKDIPSLIDSYAAEFGIPPEILRAQAQQESKLNPKVVSKAGARGVMQLMPHTAKSLGVTDSFDPEQNVRGGAQFMRDLHDRFGGDWSQALAAYNWGPEKVQKAIDKHGENWLSHTPRETQKYVHSILAAAL